MTNPRDLIKRHEGLRLTPYKDTLGKWTIGWGHCLDSHGEAVPDEITLEKAAEYFEADFARAYNAAREISGFAFLNEARKAVIISMAFQLGPVGVGRFRKMLAAIATGRYIRAAYEMLDSLWARQTPERAAELAIMMAGGVSKEEA